MAIKEISPPHALIKVVGQICLGRQNGCLEQKDTSNKKNYSLEPFPKRTYFLNGVTDYKLGQI